jgi:hypothetical protein
MIAATPSRLYERVVAVTSSRAERWRSKPAGVPGALPSARSNHSKEKKETVGFLIILYSSVGEPCHISPTHVHSSVKSRYQRIYVTYIHW